MRLQPSLSPLPMQGSDRSDFGRHSLRVLRLSGSVNVHGRNGLPHLARHSADDAAHSLGKPLPVSLLVVVIVVVVKLVVKSAALFEPTLNLSDAFVALQRQTLLKLHFRLFSQKPSIPSVLSQHDVDERRVKGRIERKETNKLARLLFRDCTLNLKVVLVT
jgi:hypothetical protein